MTRPLSWYPLAAFDPVPGDPAEVLQASREYAAVAEAIATASDGLVTIADADPHCVSAAMEAVHEHAKAVAADIAKAQKRYQAVADALAEFADPLDRAQADSLTALSEARSAQRAIDEAHHTLRTTDWDAPAGSAVGSTLGPGSNPALIALRAGLSDADRALDRARQHLADAAHARDVAAARAVARIQATTGSDHLHDSFWQNTLHVTHWVSEVFGKIAAITGALALLLCWVPIVGEVLAAVSLIAGAVALVADIVLLCSGEGSWLDVTLGALAIVTFGLGRLVGTGLKIGVRSAEAAEASAKAGRAERVVAEGLAAKAGSVEAAAAGSVSEGSRASRAALGSDVATRALSRAGVKEMVGSLKPSEIVHDLGETVSKVPQIRPGLFTPGATDAFGATIGNVETGRAIVNIDKVVGNVARDAQLVGARTAVDHALTAVAGGIVLDKVVLGATVQHVLFAPGEAGPVDRLHVND
ncbi:hypothetical protein [Cellulomonas sp. URHB0016]